MCKFIFQLGWIRFLINENLEKFFIDLRFDIFAGLGFINVEKLLKHRRFRDKCNVEDLRRIVAQDAKQRYLLRQDPHTGVLQIRANHGHTIPVEDDGTLLQKITREHGITEATHRTSSSAWYVSVNKVQSCPYAKWKA